MSNFLIALDCDGVLLDFNLAYAAAWQKYTGNFPFERDPDAYWSHERWNVQRLNSDQLNVFRTFFDFDFWSSLPPMNGAVQACHRLRESGYDLVCVSALDVKFVNARLANLKMHGFPIDRVIATGRPSNLTSPKAEVIHRLIPAAFIDDYLPFLNGISSEIHTGLILRGPNGSPNTGPGLTSIGSTHANLRDFSSWWLARR